METQKVLIIGATGAAGKLLVERTLAEGYVVTALFAAQKSLASATTAYRYCKAMRST